MGTAEAVHTIIESLNERDELPSKQIAEIVEVLGPDVSLELLAETRRVQTEGGLAVRDGTRRRTDGGVFFSLAKGKLPKTDRNRIFRVRPPKVESTDGPAAVTEGEGQSPPPPRHVEPTPPRAREAASPPANGAGASQQIAQGPGRRRVVEVEVLRQHVRPAPPPPRIAPPAPPPAAAEPRQSPPAEARPVRRIFTVGAQPREEPPPTTVEAAKERVRSLLKALSPTDQRRALAALLSELAPAEPEAPPAPKRGPDPEAAFRERVLASVTDALGLGSGDLARALFGEDSPGAKSKARVALERWRKSER